MRYILALLLLLIPLQANASLIIADGFEDGSCSRWGGTDNDASASITCNDTSPKFSGSYSVNTETTGQYQWSVFYDTVSGDEIWYTFFFYFPSGTNVVNSTVHIAYVADVAEASYAILEVNIDEEWNLGIFGNDDFNDTNSAITTNIWQCVEVGFKNADSGWIKLYVNEATIAEWTGIDTRITETEWSLNGAGVSWSGDNSNTFSPNYDEFIYSTERIGCSRLVKPKWIPKVPTISGWGSVAYADDKLSDKAKKAKTMLHYSELAKKFWESKKAKGEEVDTQIETNKKNIEKWQKELDDALLLQ